MSALTPEVEARFWSHVAKGDGCWEWTASAQGRGYGQFNGGPGIKLAHRIAWELINGPIPSGLMVLHHCDNRRCVRADPDPSKSHLFLGTAADNTADMLAKGRNKASPGEASGNAKLAVALLHALRERWRGGETAKALALEVGVHPVTMLRALKGESWTHSL